MVLSVHRKIDVEVRSFSRTQAFVNLLSAVSASACVKIKLTPPDTAINKDTALLIVPTIISRSCSVVVHCLNVHIMRVFQSLGYHYDR